ncbi:alpha-E domain-containing protein [Agitococcus lubricus]|uniref:Uncharacterized protein with alpha-helical domain and ER motif n=1 Tax=Agitococcus lubricus TaxID=1077255 RepID=A0A2T5J461_9GAMM|nr:alpha-E domain-containing protein [Agitococcus lubricus]PTQ91399.1 uncharacterized protein with alpha-helical domain and ER motif [Agitococcus lubricus]
MLLLSTAADLYWLGRYFSRSQALVDLLLDCLKNPSIESLGIPLSITGTWQNFYQQYMTLSPEALAEFFITANNPTSLSACLEATRADAQATRGRISDELWVAINSLWLSWQERSRMIGVYSDHVALYKSLQQDLSAIDHMIAQTQDQQAQRLMLIGLYVEQLDHAFRKLATPDAKAPSKTEVQTAAASLAQQLMGLDGLIWHNAQQAGQDLLSVTQLLPEQKELTRAKEAQLCLQGLTHCLTDVFAT